MYMNPIAVLKKYIFYHYIIHTGDKMAELYEKMVKEALAAQRADVDTISKNRGGKFKITDTNHI